MEVRVVDTQGKVTADPPPPPLPPVYPFTLKVNENTDGLTEHRLSPGSTSSIVV